MKIVSLFSGIGGFDEAGRRLGMETVLACEIDRQSKAVYRRHFPGVKIHGDIRKLKQLPDHDVLCAGFPCQDISLAGRRAGLAGEQSGLFHEIIRCARTNPPRWILLENVPGLLSSANGLDMGIVIGALVDLGFGVAWRVLDSEYFGVPQRRNRVYIVGCLGDAARAAKVLFEPESECWNPAPRRKKRADVAACVRGGTESGSNEMGNKVDCLNSGGNSGGFRTEPGEHLIMAHGQEAPIITHALSAEGADASEDGTGRGTPLILDMANAAECQAVGAITAAHDRGNRGHAVAFQSQASASQSMNPSEQYPALGTTKTPAVHMRSIIRRLTPLECERLMGLPDGWTETGVDAKGNEIQISDSLRYRMLGNAVVVQVVEWTLGRIAKEV